ncbi:trypsin-like cysteine/serine peptidase domain-containing protein [Xylaria sp. FL0064]|nr:trypsin-like cysteine/serine peptidase domain-containing protein [Xylaria sp. FL0064]
MPIIIHTKDQTLAGIDLDTDKNRKLLKDVQNKETKALGGSICALMRRQDLVTDGKDYKIRDTPLQIFERGNPIVIPAPRTLDQKLRYRIANEIVSKKRDLVDAYPNPLNRQDKSFGELDGFAWPNTEDPDFTALIKNFKPVKCPAFGTGFYIGNNLVVTAAHCLLEDDDIGSYLANLDDYRLVFNFTNTDNKVPAENVFRITRVVHLNAPGEVPLDPNQQSLARPSSPYASNSPQVQYAYLLQKSEPYDVVIVEITGNIDERQRLPVPLVLDPAPAAIGTRVFSIGCSHGLPFVHADAPDGDSYEANPGTVKRTQDPNRSAARQGSFTADIDCFKGNSGGPLFKKGKSTTVVGIDRSGTIYPYLSETGRPEFANKAFVDQIERWTKGRTNNTQVLDSDFLNFYTELRASHDNTRISWIRFKGNADGIVGLNAFSRTDPYAFLTMPMSEYQNNLRGGVTIKVQIAPGYKNLHPLKGNLQLTITGPRPDGGIVTCAGTPISLGNNWLPESGVLLSWCYPNSAAAGVVNTPTTPLGLIGTLPNELLPWGGGVCSWRSIGLRRTGAEYKDGEMEPGECWITVKFTMPEDSDRPIQYMREAAFKLELEGFERVAGNNNEWQRALGGASETWQKKKRRGPWWTGPITLPRP